MPEIGQKRFEELNQQFVELYRAGRFQQAMGVATQASDLARKLWGESNPNYASTLNNLAENWRALGNWGAAEELHLKALQIQKRALGEMHPDVSNSLNGLGSLYENLGRTDQAEQMFRQALEIRRQTLGEKDPRFATSLSNLAGLYHRLGRFAEAEPLLRQVVQIDQQTYGEDHPEFATDLSNLGSLYRDLGQYPQAETLFFKALQIRLKTLGEVHPAVAATLMSITGLYCSMARFKEALKPAQMALNINRQTLGDTHPQTASSMTALGKVYRFNGDFPAAEPLYLKTLELARRDSREWNPDLVDALNECGELYRLWGRFESAEPFYLEALELYRKAHRELELGCGAVSNNLALVYKALGRYKDAERLAKKSLEIARTRLRQGHPTIAIALDSLASLYLETGNYEASEPLYLEALEITRKSLGEHNPHFAEALNSLAEQYRFMGRYSAAEPLYRRALEVTEATLGKTHPNYAKALNNLGLVYTEMQNEVAAEPLLRESLEITRARLGESHPSFAAALTSLGSIYRAMGEYAKAEPLLLQALEIRRERFGEMHIEYAVSLNQLALLYLSTYKYSLAEPLFRQSLQIEAKVFGEDNPRVVHALLNFAIVQGALGNLDQSESLARKALEVGIRTLGEMHSLVAQARTSLASTLAATHRPAEALQLFWQASAADDNMIGQVFSVGSERHRMRYLQSIRANFEAFLSLVLGYLTTDKTAVCRALDLVLKRKGIAAEALSAQRDAILGGKYPSLQSQLRALNDLREQIAQKTLAGPGTEGPQSYQNQLAQWKQRQEEIEALLARQIPEMNLEKKLRSASREAVSQALPKDSALIELVRFTVYDFAAVAAKNEAKWKHPRYLAFILFAAEPDNVKMIDIGSALLIDDLVASFRIGLTGEKEDRLLSVGLPEAPVLREHDRNELRTLLVDPILNAVGKGKQLLIAPDGNLSRLPFEVLPASGGKLLVDEYKISYLGTGRDMLRFKQPSNTTPNLSVVVADPDFNLTTDGTATEGSKPRRQDGGKPRMISGQGMHFEPLPGSREEGEKIAYMLHVLPWLQEGALKRRVRSCKAPRILHLATHGFFLPDLKIELAPELGSSAIQSRSAVFENPLLRSGLALAGANTWGQGNALPPDAEDGVLTAEDVSGLDLLGTELVVLSACETGLGHVVTGEGVFGLRRSFVLAGAQGLIMSLWKVPDEQTQQLMENFYHLLLCEDFAGARGEALRAAQIIIKEHFPDPFFWGAFIYQGDPFPAASRDSAGSHTI
jgi:tetratricopeptide (TPR) repeat protein